MQSADFIIIGGGLIGLATAYELLVAHPNKQVIVLEKEQAIAQHQSSRNSGIVHSGIYYAPNSKKAQHTKIGRELLKDFCHDQQITLTPRSKVIVAMDESELNDLQILQQQGVANGVDCELISPNRLHDLEPYAAGVAAVEVHDVYVVDYASVAHRLAENVRQMGGTIRHDQKVSGVHESDEGVIIRTQNDTFVAQFAVNAAGLYADRVAEASGLELDTLIAPFRGEYYQLRRDQARLCNGIIAPVPSAEMPFTGVMLTRTASDTVLCGPNAVLASSREGYRRSKLSARTFYKQITSPEVLALTRQNFQTAWGEYRRSWSKKLFAYTIQRLVPTVTEADLLDAEAGVRTQAILTDGSFVNDFVFYETDRMMHIINAPSPGGTACLSIGRTITEAFSSR